jgi:hypothetical protein
MRSIAWSLVGTLLVGSLGFGLQTEWVLAQTSAPALDGDWALMLPNREVGWLQISHEQGQPQAALLWAVGSARPVDKLEVRGQALAFSRSIKRPLAPKDEPATRYQIVVRAEGDRLLGTMTDPATSTSLEFSGCRQPPLPAPPKLEEIQFGEPIDLLAGEELRGWVATNPAKKMGWSFRDGCLTNDTPKTDFGAYGEYANLRTEAEFEDFQLHIEYRLPPETGGNSGIYLRGMYEVQVTHRDSSMQGIAGPGAVFGRIAPTHNAGLPAGTWELLDIALVDRHITVKLNGQLVIDNQPVLGCTGGALLSDVRQPGPIMLQGDHTSVQYRNIQLRPRL